MKRTNFIIAIVGVFGAGAIAALVAGAFYLGLILKTPAMPFSIQSPYTTIQNVRTLVVTIPDDTGRAQDDAMLKEAVRQAKENGTPVIIVFCSKAPVEVRANDDGPLSHEFFCQPIIFIEGK